MNVIIDARMVKNELHGIARYTYEIVNRLADKVNIKLIVNDENTAGKLFKKVEFISMRSGFLSMKEQFELPFVVDRYRGDTIFHSPSIASSPFMRSASILTIHDLTPLKFPEFYSSIHKYYYSFIVKPAAKRAKKILTVSEYSKMDIIKWLECDEDKVVVTYNGVEDRFRIIENKEKLLKVKKKYNLPDRFILYIGNMKPHKNVKNLVKSMQHVNQDVKLVINGKPNGEIDIIIKEFNLQEKLQFIGYVDDEDLPAMYNLAELFLYPSLYEGFGLPPLEAMSCGCPVITSNTSSLPEVVGDTQIMVDPYDVFELGNAINLVLSNEDLRQKMIQKGLEQSKRFTWERTARETLDVYEEVYKYSFK